MIFGDFKSASRTFFWSLKIFGEFLVHRNFCQLPGHIFDPCEFYSASRTCFSSQGIFGKLLGHVFGSWDFFCQPLGHLSDPLKFFLSFWDD